MAAEEIEEQDDSNLFYLNQLLETSNIAEDLTEDELDKIGRDVVSEYEIDEKSREAWIKQNEEWMELALQISKTKNYPWPNASNVKYPLMTTAAIQFAARAYPALIKNPSMVKAKVTGRDKEGKKGEIALNISQHMSWQVLEQMEEWEEDMDKLTLVVPISGCAFKKSYFSQSLGRNVSELVHARDLCINYYAPTLESAIRKTHILELYDNDIVERVRRGTFRDVDLGKNNDALHILRNPRRVNDKVNKTQVPNDSSEKKPRIVLEQHRLLDLDEDGYEEPYIVTVDYVSKKVLRIVARFDVDGIETNDKGEIVKITPVEYFTKYGFIPNPDGGIYDVGFGILLGSLNHSANTVMNLLIDGGTLSNMQSGFISRGLRLKAGKKRLRPGEWVNLNSTGIDLKQGIFPLPVREPSNVLFSLLGMILESGEKLSSIVDVLTGENPGQNQKATTTLALIEQGLKVFTAIHKRMYNAMDKEFKKLYRLNSIYLSAEEYYEILGQTEDQGGTIGITDYQTQMISISPAADPNIATEMQKITKAQAAVELAQGTGEVNLKVAVRRLLEALDQPNIDELTDLPERGPSIDELEIQLKSKELELKEKEMESHDVLEMSQSILALAKAEKESITSTLDQLTSRLDGLDKLAEVIVKLSPDDKTNQET